MKYFIKLKSSGRLIEFASPSEARHFVWEEKIFETINEVEWLFLREDDRGDRVVLDKDLLRY